MNSNHWNEIYKHKSDQQVSWFQETPEISLKLIEGLKLSLTTSIIDIGAGNSRLGDSLLKRGFADVSLLDISEEAIERARLRLGSQIRAENCIVSDIVSFTPKRQYGLWHDRAVFHFLTEKSDVDKYVQIAADGVSDDGWMIVGTFSKTGPEKCSGLPITRYSGEELAQVFSPRFKQIQVEAQTHTTPWGSSQDFVFSIFKKLRGSSK